MAILNVRSMPSTSDQKCDPKGAIQLINEHKKYQYASFDSSVLENKHTQENKSESDVIFKTSHVTRWNVPLLRDIKCHEVERATLEGCWVIPNYEKCRAGTLNHFVKSQVKAI